MKTLSIVMAMAGCAFGIKFEAPAWPQSQAEGKERCVSLFIPPHSLVSGSAEAGAAFHMTTRAKVP